MNNVSKFSEFVVHAIYFCRPRLPTPARWRDGCQVSLRARIRRDGPDQPGLGGLARWTSLFFENRVILRLVTDPEPYQSFPFSLLRVPDSILQLGPTKKPLLSSAEWTVDSVVASRERNSCLQSSILISAGVRMPSRSRGRRNASKVTTFSYLKCCIGLTSKLIKSAVRDVGFDAPIPFGILFVV